MADPSHRMADDYRTLIGVATLAAPSLLACAAYALGDYVEGAGLTPPRWLVGVLNLSLVGGVPLSLVTTPLALLLAWRARDRVSRQGRRVLILLCALSLGAPLLLLLYAIALENLS